jgi:hypothetical protein
VRSVAEGLTFGTGFVSAPQNGESFQILLPFLPLANHEGRTTMHNRQRDFLLLVILAAISMTSPLGQGVAPAVGPASSSTRSTASIPDFSGIWSNQSLNALEPPLSGPGPVRNRSRLRTGPQAGVGDGRQLVGDYSNPILQPWAVEVVKKLGEISLAGKGYPTPRNQCWPEGMPFVSINRHCCPVDGGYDFNITLQDKGF